MMDICTVALSFTLATLPPLGEIATHQSEIVQRSVRVNFEKGTCTGILVDARTIRTAGHCFKDGGRFMNVTRYDRGKVTARFSSKFEAPPDWVSEPRAWDDDAVITADRPIADVKPIAIVDPATIPDRTPVVLGGFGLVKETFRLFPAEFTKGRAWKLVWFRDTFVGWNFDFLKPRRGDSGGGVWFVRDGKLALAGMLTRRVPNRDRLGEGTAIQPLGK